MTRNYQVTLKGLTPLLMHRDNLEWSEVVDVWQKDPKNKDRSIKGDDRSPAWRWIGSLYHDGQNVAAPTDAVMASCMKGGSSIILKAQKTYKSMTQSGMAFIEPHLTLLVNGGTSVPMSEIEKLRQEDDFSQHLKRARKLEFDLDVRRAKVGQSKHVRVRPVFNKWSATGMLSVWDDALTEDVLRQIFEIAGDQAGILEWRPNCSRPGPFGRFTVLLEAA